MIYYDNKSDAARSVENARAAAVVKPDVYIGYNVNPATNPQIGRVLKDAGIPILSVQTRVPDTPIFAVDNARSGYEACRGLSQEAKKRWGAKPPVIFLLAVSGGGTALPRTHRRVQESDRGGIPRHADPGAID